MIASQSSIGRSVGQPIIDALNAAITSYTAAETAYSNWQTSVLSAFAPAQHAVRFILGDTMAAIAPGLPGSESDQQLLNLVQETKWAPPVLLSIVDAE